MYRDDKKNLFNEIYYELGQVIPENKVCKITVSLYTCRMLAEPYFVSEFNLNREKPAHSTNLSFICSNFFLNISLV